MATSAYKTCPFCGDPKSNVSEHKKRCKKNPARDGGSRVAAPRTEAPPAEAGVRKKRGRPRVRRNGPSVPATQPSREATHAGRVLENGHCPVCSHQATALERDLITEAVREGMGLQAACSFVRRVLTVAAPRRS